MNLELAILLTLSRGLPAVRGSGRLASIFQRFYQRRRREPLIAPVLDFKMRLDPMEHVDSALLFYPQLYDHREIRLLRERLREGDVFLDVGANIGFYSLAVAGAVGSTGRVLAIEADPEIHGLLRDNAALNLFSDRIEAVLAGVSDREETLRLGINVNGNRGSSSFLADDQPRGVEVRCLPLSRILSEKGIRRVVAAKFDIEGFGYRVLRKYFEDVSPDLFPRLLIVEKEEGVPELLRSKGYRLLFERGFNEVYELPDGDGAPEFATNWEALGGGPGLLRILRRAWRSEVAVINVDSRALLALCLFKALCPWKKLKLISVDLILRAPRNFKERALATIKRILYRRVDAFILYFRDTRGYERWYGIDRSRVRYVPFKVNSWEKLKDRQGPEVEGQYVLTAGRTLRDIATFVEAMRGLPQVPAVLLRQTRELLEAHGTYGVPDASGALPQNVRLMFDRSDDGEEFLRAIADARVVVIPRFARDIAATGISTYLCAMALGRCVILSDGPAASDVLVDGEQAIIVAPEDPHALRAAIDRAWNDGELRSQVAAAGWKYAQQLQGEERLVSDVRKVIEEIRG